MATLAPRTSLPRLLLKPLSGRQLVVGGIMVWLAGAAYCHGYQRLLTGVNPGPWSGSLIWSAFAVAPWFALFEWSKHEGGSSVMRRPAALIALVLALAVVSIACEYLVSFCVGEITDRVGLLIMRRVPAIAFSVVLIALARRSMDGERSRAADSEAIERLAPLASYVAAADNYVEVHLPERIAIRRMTLTQAATALRRYGFVRIHRRYLVNRAEVAAVEMNGRRIVRLRCGQELPIGSAYAANAASTLGFSS